MQIGQGIATDYNKEKWYCTLDENDLIRLINEYGISQSPDQLTTGQAMLLLSLEAERFVLVQSPKYGKPVEDLPDGTWGVRSQLRDNREQFAAALAQVTSLSIEEMRVRVGLTAVSA